MKLVLSNLKLDPPPSSRWPGTGGAVSVDERVGHKGSCRSGCRPSMLLFSMLSLVSQQFPEKERHPWRFLSNTSVILKLYFST